MGLWPQRREAGTKASDTYLRTQLSYDLSMQLRALVLLFTSFQSSPEFIAKMRDAAVSYADRLQDFLCTQSTTRSGLVRFRKTLETP
jgi:hypothetical protein